MEIKTLGLTIECREIAPADFLDEAGGFPLSKFIEKRALTMWEQVQTENKTEEKNDIEEALKHSVKIFNLAVIKINKQEITAQSFIDKGKPEMVIHICNLIVTNSLKMFKGNINIDSNQVDFYDIMAKRYGRTPIECLMPNGGYSNLDSYLFNRYILCRAMQKEKAEASKADLQTRRDKMKGGRK